MALLALALALAAGPGQPGELLPRLPPAPVSVYRVLWQRPLVAPVPLEAHALELGGVAADPATRMAVVGTRDGWLHAFKADGSLAWERQGDSGFLAPALVDGNVVYAVTAGGQVWALELETGKPRWTYEAKEELAARPVLAGGRLYLATSQDRLFALDARTGEWLWNHRREGKASGFSIHGISTPVLTDGKVFTSYSDGYVAALDPATGQVAWEKQVGPPGDYVDVDSLQTDGKRLFAAAYSGAVLALDPKTGAPLWAFRVPQPARLGLAGDTLVTVTASQLVGLDARTGEKLWARPFDGTPTWEPVTAGRWLTLPSGAPGLQFIDGAKGRTLRTFDPGTGVSGPAAVVGDRLYVLSNGGSLFALELR